MKVFLKTYGCQMNERDSEFVTGLLLDAGCAKAESAEEADVVLFNTCSVRRHAEERAISNMGALLKGRGQGAGGREKNIRDDRMHGTGDEGKIIQATAGA